MSERSSLVARKESVRARLAQLQRELERTRLQPRSSGKQLRRIEEQIEQLMAEEAQLRQQIDQSHKDSGGEQESSGKA